MVLNAIGAVVAVVLTLPPGATPGSEPLYGRVTDTDGRVVEGWLRWDRNEAGSDDWLDAALPVPLEDLRVAERLDLDFAAAQRARRSLVAFGVRLTWEIDDEADPVTTRAALRFGHVSAVVPLDARSARLELRDGRAVELRGNTTDLGRGMRALVVVSRDGERHSFRWAELERVELLPAPTGVPPTGRRLHGTVTTWSEETFTGDIAWDLDEIVEDDILDGRADGEDLEIPFADIASIDYENDRSSRVTLRSGEELVLRGTNDVDEDNRGIEVSDPAFGRAIVHWPDFRSVRFHAPEPGPAAPDFAPGDTLRASVHAVDGRVIEGLVRWNNTRSMLWQTLDGWSGDTELSVELGSIRTIRKADDDSVEVTTTSGRTFLLDVEPEEGVERRAVFIVPDGRPTRIVLWRDFERLEVSR